MAFTETSSDELFPTKPHFFPQSSAGDRASGDGGMVEFEPAAILAPRVVLYLPSLIYRPSKLSLQVLRLIPCTSPPVATLNRNYSLGVRVPVEPRMRFNKIELLEREIFIVRVPLYTLIVSLSSCVA